VTNFILQNDDTPITWQDASGTLVITLNNLAAGTGRQGAIHDFGVAARSRYFAWRFFCQFETAPVVNETVDIYWKSSDGSKPDNDDGTGDAALSATDKLNNLQLLGVLRVDEAATGVVMAVSGLMIAEQEQGMPVIFNNTADNLVATNNLNGFLITPIPDEIQ